MMGIIPNTNDEIDYAELFDPGEKKQAIGHYDNQRHGDLYAPDTEKWQKRDCPLCFEPFSVEWVPVPKGRAGWYCTHCHRKIN